MNEPRFADVSATGDLLWIVSLSGPGILYPDPLGAHCILAASVSDEALGEVVRDALQRSRAVERTAENGLDGDSVERSREERVRELMSRLGVKRRGAVFTGMRKCYVIAEETGTIRCAPTRRLRGETWEGMPREWRVTVPRGASSARLGRCIRDALDRCTVR